MEIANSQTILNFQAGDEKAFRQVFEHFYPALLAFIRKLTGSQEEAEDISLNAFQALFNRCRLFNTEDNIKAFLYISARNSSLNYLKSKKRIEEKQKRFAARMQNDTALQYEYEMKSEIVEAISNAIENLPEECKKIFKLLIYKELKPAEVADMLQISVSTVYNQKSRAVQALRIMLSENSMAIAWLLLTIARLQIDILHPACGIQP
ncbi:MAG TPA: RNA polymerase sigma-70 factor [Niastella sp.]